ncbi:GNAT family N-acetyltransferase [Streptococcus didelphis]|uniref:GNAT family N-acetyltransferase n=1 Tax=Streptococcus didelphis TaxID=102886 RepID=UPI0027D2174D|nr:GNAT family N-acetyltransferase [Streptococcus didelphis]
MSKHIIFTNKLENLKLRRADLKNILIEELDKEWLPAYLDLKYHQNLEFGEDFAKLMFEFNKHNLPEKGSRIYIAREGNKLVGDVTAWYFDDYVEIDDFSVVKEYQGRGIGSALQLKASEGYNKLILVSKEINRKMYEHQGYKEVAYYWTALRSSRKS